MLASILLVRLVAAPAPTSAAPATPAGDAVQLGALEIGPSDGRAVTILDAGGERVATVVARDTPTQLRLPVGRYRIVGEDSAPAAPERSEGRTDGPVASVSVEAGQRAVVELPGAPPKGPRPPSAKPKAARPTVARDAKTTGARWRRPRGPGSRTAGPRWRAWGAPLLSALVPGLGQAVNREAGKAVGVFTATAALVGASIGVGLAGDPDEGATPRDAGDSDAVEITRLGALSALSSAAVLVYLGQILDAHAVAVGKWPAPHRDYAVELGVTRMSTVGLSPGQPAYALYDDISISLMGQVAPTVAFGLADASIKFGGDPEQITLQAGLRATWRFFERERWWLLLGGGIFAQGTAADRSNPPLGEGARSDDRERRFGAVPYVQLEARWFLLDRWSLNIAPRVSVPLTDRDYRGGRRIPRFATTFELGTGLGVHF